MSKLVLIVGASRGIGLQLAKDSVLNGYQPILTCRKLNNEI
jgi:short-subunit dehydrogenase